MKRLNIHLITAVTLMLVTLFYLVILKDTNKAMLSSILATNILILGKLESKPRKSTRTPQNL